MWKPLSIVSGVALLASGGIIYSMVRPVLTAEKIQAANAEDYKAKATKEKRAQEKAIKQAKRVRICDSLKKIPNPDISKSPIFSGPDHPGDQEVPPRRQLRQRLGSEAGGILVGHRHAQSDRNQGLLPQVRR